MLRKRKWAQKDEAYFGVKIEGKHKLWMGKKCCKKMKKGIDIWRFIC